MNAKIYKSFVLFMVACFLFTGMTGCSIFSGTPTANVVEKAAQATVQAVVPTEEILVPTQTPILVQVEKTVEVVITSTPHPTLDPSLIFTGSLPNFCNITNTMQEDIDGEMLVDIVIYLNSALGANQCAATFEGRWFEGWLPTDDHHITMFFGAAENTSVYQGSQWLIPPGTSIREIAYGLSIGKCDNWANSGVDPEPVVFDYIDMTTDQIVHTAPTTCDELRKGNPLPEEIGLIPGIQLPHYSVGYTWGQVPIGLIPTPIPAGSFAGVSKYDLENRGLVCGSAGPALGNNEDGISKIDPAWDKQCIYVVDGAKSIGGVDNKPAIGLIRGADLIKAVGSYDASIWVVPSDWVALKNAEQFAAANCPIQLPILIYEGGWIQLEVFTCP